MPKIPQSKAKKTALSFLADFEKLSDVDKFRVRKRIMYDRKFDSTVKPIINGPTFAHRHAAAYGQAVRFEEKIHTVSIWTVTVKTVYGDFSGYGRTLVAAKTDAANKAYIAKEGEIQHKMEQKNVG